MGPSITVFNQKAGGLVQVEEEDRDAEPQGSNQEKLMCKDGAGRWPWWAQIRTGSPMTVPGQSPNTPAWG